MKANPASPGLAVKEPAFLALYLLHFLQLVRDCLSCLLIHKPEADDDLNCNLVATVIFSNHPEALFLLKNWLTCQNRSISRRRMEGGGNWRSKYVRRFLAASA